MILPPQPPSITTTSSRSVSDTWLIAPCHWSNLYQQLAKSVCLPFLEIGEFDAQGFDSGLRCFQTLSSQTNNLKIDTCRLLAWRSALLGSGKDWLAQCQDNATEWDSRSWCWQSDVPVRQHYEVALSVHCNKLVPNRLPLPQACLTTVKHSFIPYRTIF